MKVISEFIDIYDVLCCLDWRLLSYGWFIAAMFFNWCEHEAVYLCLLNQIWNSRCHITDFQFTLIGNKSIVVELNDPGGFL